MTIKILKTPEEVADFINHITNMGDMEVGGSLREDIAWVVVRNRTTGEEVEYKLETVKLAKEMELIEDKE